MRSARHPRPTRRTATFAAMCFGVLAAQSAQPAGPALPAGAALPLGCFERTYGEAHLAQIPGQTVRRIVVSIRRSESGAEFGVRTWVRRKPQMWLAGGTCVQEGDGWTCRPDTDGASTLRLEPAGRDLKLSNPGRLKIYDDRTGPGLSTRMIGGAPERSFLLAPAINPARTCQPLG